MPFKKGMSGNPNGRTPGKANKTTLDTRAFLQELLEAEQGRFLDALHGLEGEAYCRVYIRLLSFVIPKQKDIDPPTEPAQCKYILPDGTVLMI